MATVTSKTTEIKAETQAEEPETEANPEWWTVEVPESPHPTRVGRGVVDAAEEGKKPSND